MRLSKWCSVFLAVASLSVALALPAGAAIRGWYVADSLAYASWTWAPEGDTTGARPGLGRTNGTGTYWLPYRTIRAVNSQVGPGDTVYVYGVTHSDTADVAANKICPATAGTAAARITYIGMHGANDRGLHLPIASVLDTVSYISVRNFRIKGAVDFMHMANSKTSGYSYPRATVAKQPTADSVRSCFIQRVNFSGADSCVVESCTVINGGPTGGVWPTVTWYANDGARAGSEGYCGSGNATYDLNPGFCVSSNHANVFSHNIVNMGNIEAGGNLQNVGLSMRSRSQYNVVEDNTFTGTFEGTSPTVYGRMVQYANHNTFSRNKWTFDGAHAATGNGWTAFRMQDSSFNNTFRRDTVYAGLTTHFRHNAYLVGSGTYNGANTWSNYDSCFFRIAGPTYINDAWTNGAISYSAFDNMTGPCLSVTGAMDNTSLVHNTFFCRGLGPAVKLGTLAQFRRSYIQRNIFFADSATTADSTLVGGEYCYHSTANPVLMVPDGAFDRLAYYLGDRNLFWVREGMTVDPPKEHLAISSTSTGLATSSDVGSGSCWSNLYGHDNVSLFADPDFADTTWSAPDLRFAQGTVGDSVAFIDYAGAYAPSSPTTLPDSTYDIDGAMVLVVNGGTTQTEMVAVFQPPATKGHIVEAIILTGTARDTITTAAWAATIAADTMSVIVVEPDATDIGSGATPQVYFLKSVTGTHAVFWVQTRVTDIYGNKSRFGFRKIE
jgi:hypothetical protein